MRRHAGARADRLRAGGRAPRHLRPGLGADPLLAAGRGVFTSPARLAAAPGTRAGGRLGEPSRRRYRRSAALRHRRGSRLHQQRAVARRRGRGHARSVLAVGAPRRRLVAAAALGASLCKTAHRGQHASAARGGRGLERIPGRDAVGRTPRAGGSGRAARGSPAGCARRPLPGPRPAAAIGDLCDGFVRRHPGTRRDRGDVRARGLVRADRTPERRYAGGVHRLPGSKFGFGCFDRFFVHRIPSRARQPRARGRAARIARRERVAARRADPRRRARRAAVRRSERRRRRRQAGAGCGEHRHSGRQQSRAARRIRRRQVDAGRSAAALPRARLGTHLARRCAARRVRACGSAPAHRGGRTFAGAVQGIHSG